MPRPNRVFMTGSSIEQVKKEAKRNYGYEYDVVDVKYDPKKKVPASARATGKTKYYRVYLKPLKKDN